LSKVARKNNDILIIPDSHAHPDYDNHRMTWLGRFINEMRPGTVVHIGDMSDMACFNSHEEGRSKWGKEYGKDIKATKDHQQKLWAPVKYNPTKVYCLGNHEVRAETAINANPEFSGSVDYVADIGATAVWDFIVPFKAEYCCSGISFSHYFANGLRGSPIGGVAVAKSMCDKLGRSAVQGHSHLLGYYYKDRGLHLPRVECWSVGCYSHPAQIEGWNANTVAMWRYGVLYLRNVGGGIARDGWDWKEQSWLKTQFS